MKTAARANYIQSVDATVVRIYISFQNKSFITIHDCFLTDWLSTSLMVAEVNEAMQIEINNLDLSSSFIDKEIFSLFIVL